MWRSQGDSHEGTTITCLRTQTHTVCWVFWRQREQTQHGTGSELGNSDVCCLKTCIMTYLESCAGGRRPQGWTHFSHVPAPGSPAATTAQGTGRGGRCHCAQFPGLGEALCHAPWEAMHILACTSRRKALTDLYWGHFSGLCFQWETLEDEVTSPPKQKTGLLKLIIKMMNSPGSGCSPLMAAHCVCKHRPLGPPSSSRSLVA